MILGPKCHLLFGILPMIVYFIEWSSLEDSKKLQCDLDSSHSYSKWISISENVLFYNAIEWTSLSSKLLNFQPNSGVWNYLTWVSSKTNKWNLLCKQTIIYCISKASKVLNFLKWNLYKCSTSTKATAYVSLVWPILGYASSVWDPYQYNKIYIIDRIQCRAACWSFCNYERYSSVTRMQHQLNW